MGSTNFGNQLLSFDFNQDATAKLFNNTSYGLLPNGIYSGFTLTKLSNTYVTISVGISYISDSSNNLGVRIETSEEQSIVVSNAKPYVILRFDWVDAANNYMDMLSIEYENILPDDLIVGRCVYDAAGTMMATTFDYTRRTRFYNYKQKTESEYLKVSATEPITDQITVSSGVVNSSKGNLLISGGNYPIGGLTDTINGRYDLVYIDEDGNIEILEGIDSSSPIAPRYANRKVIAEIRRGAVRDTVYGNEIFPVISSFDMNAITSDLLLIDTNNLYTTDNVEAAFQELAGEDMVIKGNKLFTDSLSIEASLTKVGLKVKGASGQNILEIRKSDNTLIMYVDQNGKIYNTIGTDLALTDTYNVFTIDKIADALNQIAGGTLTIKGAKTFESTVAMGGNPAISTGSTTAIANLNADLHDGYHAGTVGAGNTIPVNGGIASFTELFATARMRIPIGAPASPANGDIWIG